MLAALWIGLTGAAAEPGEPDEPCLGPQAPAEVIALAEPLTARLADGRRVRLADVAPADWAGGPSPPGDIAATARAVQLLSVPPDRYGRLAGDIVLEATGGSLRARLLADGLAFVDPTVMSKACLSTLFEAEREAERAGRGLWADDTLVADASRPMDPQSVGRYAFVSGRVRSIGETKQTIYLNFGTNYRTDFTVLIVRAEAKGWAEEVLALEGQHVRVRGVLEEWNGGLIRVEHPAQIERLP